MMNDPRILPPPAIRLKALPDADPALPAPRYESAGAAGADLRANLPAAIRDAGIVLPPGGRALIPTALPSPCLRGGRRRSAPVPALR